MLSERERFGASAAWSDDTVTEIIYMLRCGDSCAQVADRFRTSDDEIVQIGWGLWAAGVDVRGLRPLGSHRIPTTDRRPNFPLLKEGGPVIPIGVRNALRRCANACRLLVRQHSPHHLASH